MPIDETLAKIKKYEQIVVRYVSENKVNAKEAPDSYWIIRGACLEALAILEGDEQKFKECLDATINKNPGMGWGFDFDRYNTQQAAGYIKTLARLMREKKP